MSSIFALLVFIAATVAVGQKVRPTVPKLYISEAGRTPVTETMVKSFSRVTICPDDYPNGFTVRCDVQTGPDFPIVVWRVNNAVYRRHFKAGPYYIQGANAFKVRPFKFDDFIGLKKVRIACKVRQRKEIRIVLLRGCPEPEPEPSSDGMEETTEVAVTEMIA